MSYQPFRVIEFQTIVVEEQYWFYSIHIYHGNRVDTHLEGIRPKVNATVSITSQGLPVWSFQNYLHSF